MPILTGVDGLAQCTTTGAAVMVTGTTAFTIAGGPIRITDLVSICITTCDATASTLQWRCDGTVGAATTISAASGSLESFAAGGLVICDFTTINTAPVVTATTGVGLAGPATSTGGGIYCPAGIINYVIAVGSTTGTFKHYLRWLPMRPGVTVTAAF